MRKCGKTSVLTGHSVNGSVSPLGPVSTTFLVFWGNMTFLFYSHQFSSAVAYEILRRWSLLFNIKKR